MTEYIVNIHNIIELGAGAENNVSESPAVKVVIKIGRYGLIFE